MTVCEIFFKLKFSKFIINIRTLDVFGKFLLIVQGMNLKVPNDTNFFWATFCILCDPLEFSDGACPTPSGTEMVKTHQCAVY